MSKTLRIGYIGAGGNTKKMHLPGFAAIKGVTHEVVANRSVASSEKVAQEFGIKRIASDWKEVVSDPLVDAICIGTWPYLHKEISIAALQAGKHVLCEARIAMNLEEALEMQSVSRTHPDQVLQIVPAPFTLPYDSLVQDMLARKALGTIREVLVHHATGAHVDSALPLSWRQRKEYSGENILSMGIFHETIYRWYRENPLSIIAHGYTATNSRLNPETNKLEPVEIPDAVTINGIFPSGARLHYEFSSLECGPPRMEIRINGEKGSLSFDGQKNTLTSWQSPDAEGVIHQPNHNQGWKVEADFVASIRDGQPVRLTSVDDAVAYMQFTRMVQDSLAARRT